MVIYVLKKKRKKKRKISVKDSDQFLWIELSRKREGPFIPRSRVKRYSLRAPIFYSLRNKISTDIGSLNFLKNDQMNGRSKRIFRRDKNVTVWYIPIQEILKKLSDIFISFHIVNPQGVRKTIYKKSQTRNVNYYK